MISPVLYASVASVSLALAIMPAGACPRQAAAGVSPPAPRVQVVATADGYAIAAKKLAPPEAAPRKAVPLGVQLQIDRDAFECSTRRVASAGQ